MCMKRISCKGFTEDQEDAVVKGGYELSPPALCTACLQQRQLYGTVTWTARMALRTFIPMAVLCCCAVQKFMSCEA